jgi:hypothetical protein
VIAVILMPYWFLANHTCPLKIGENSLDKNCEMGAEMAISEMYSSKPINLKFLSHAGDTILNVVIVATVASFKI